MKRIYFSLLILLSFSGMMGQDLKLKLVVPQSTPEGVREIYLPKYQRLHAILTNNGETAIRLWKDWNSWGWNNLRLIWEVNGKSFAIRRIIPPKLDGDFPDFWILNPGESLVLEIDMSTGKWDGFPDLYGEKIPARLYAIYENKQDLLSREFDVWTGQVRSETLDVVFR